ncbi:MAG: hypothetical protein KC586_08365, partial [Myxococcales bacterium]|nr:hypothetical protein [Myxococcales bacterium]
DTSERDTSERDTSERDTSERDLAHALERRAGERRAGEHPNDAPPTDALPPVLRLVEPEGPSVDPVTVPQRALLALFEGRAALRFPGIDHEVLEGEAQTVRALAIAVDRARAALALAENALADRQRELQRVYVQAHEYASIFARDDETLRAELDAISLRNDAPKKKRRQDDEPPKRRGRPPKSEAAELPFSAG